MKHILVALLVTSCAAMAMSPRTARADTMDAFIELLREGVRAEKVALVDEVMRFSEEEASAFWPVYRKYDREVKKLNDRRLALIKRFAENYYDMDDDMANKLVKESIELRIARNYLRKDYQRRFAFAISPKRAAQFMQLDYQISLLVDLEIASELPLIE